MSLLALISARGGSKGIPRKNIKPLAGKSLIGWTIDAARQSSYIDRIVVTTEDDEIASLSRELGADVPFMRPPELAADDTPGIAPVLHAVDQLPDFEWVLLLQPTSPLRTQADIDGIWEFCMAHGAPSAVSLSDASKHPYWMYRRDTSHRLQPLIADRPNVTCRQDLPKAYAVNGALYLAKTNWLQKTGEFITSETLGYLMPSERSIDLDTHMDWKLAECLIRESHNLS